VEEEEPLLRQWEGRWRRAPIIIHPIRLRGRISPIWVEATYVFRSLSGIGRWLFANTPPSGRPHDSNDEWEQVLGLPAVWRK